MCRSSHIVTHHDTKTRLAHLTDVLQVKRFVLPPRVPGPDVEESVVGCFHASDPETFVCLMPGTKVRLTRVPFEFEYKFEIYSGMSGVTTLDSPHHDVLVIKGKRFDFDELPAEGMELEVIEVPYVPVIVEAPPVAVQTHAPRAFKRVRKPILIGAIMVCIGALCFFVL